MPKDTIYYPPIGIAGAAGVGKDTLCTALTGFLKIKYRISAKRNSIAGDTIRKDLKSLIFDNTGKDIDKLTASEKTLVRPLMVEWGRYMRAISKGRYFIEKLASEEGFAENYIPIIPDIRYSEYQKDEDYWVTKEKNGILIFIERSGIRDANEAEKKNNPILKKKANLVFKIPNCDNYQYTKVMKDILPKIITIYPLDTFQLLNRS
jgi:energy-coupling factor transporter ATP-binding protein EcfA2